MLVLSKHEIHVEISNEVFLLIWSLVPDLLRFDCRVPDLGVTDLFKVHLEAI